MRNGLIVIISLACSTGSDTDVGEYVIAMIMAE